MHGLSGAFMLMILRDLSCVVVSYVVVAVIAMGCPAPPSQPDSGTPAPGSAPRAAPELPVLDPEIVEVPRPAVAPPPRPGVIDTGDLPALRARGTLRVLVQGVGEDLLPRAGGGPGREHDLAEALASQLGLRAEFIRVDRFDELIPWLREGKGDIIATRLSVTRSRQEQIAFSRPTATVDEVLVRRIDDESPPRSLADLAGKRSTYKTAPPTTRPSSTCSATPRIALPSSLPPARIWTTSAW